MANVKKSHKILIATVSALVVGAPIAADAHGRFNDSSERRQSDGEKKKKKKDRANKDKDNSVGEQTQTTGPILLKAPDNSSGPILLVDPNATGTTLGVTTTTAPVTTTTAAVTTTTAAVTTTTVAAATPTEFNGTVVDPGYGPIEVKITKEGDRIANIEMVQVPSGGLSGTINDGAVPQLIAAALEAQSAEVANVSGATFTTTGFKESLLAAINASAS